MFSFFSFFFADKEDKNDAKNEAVDRKVNVDNIAKIEVSPTPSITVDDASIPKPKEEKNPEKVAPSLSVPNFFAVFKKPDDTATKPDEVTTISNTKTSDSPPPEKEKIHVTTKPAKTIKIEIGTKVFPHPENFFGVVKMPSSSKAEPLESLTAYLEPKMKRAYPCTPSP